MPAARQRPRPDAGIDGAEVSSRPSQYCIRPSRDGINGILGGHSGFMPENLTTLAHFAVSSAMSLPKSDGEPVRGTPPRSANRAFILGSASAALISLLSFSMISVGVLLGAP